MSDQSDLQSIQQAVAVDQSAGALPPQQPVNTSNAAPPSSPVGLTPKKSSKGKWIAIILGIVILLAGLAAAGVYFYSIDSVETTTPTPTPTPVAQMSQSVLVYDADGGISIADEDGGNMQSIVEGEENVSLGFAGLSEDKGTVYYTKVESDKVSADLRKYVFATKKDESMVEFTTVGVSRGREDEAPFFDKIASVHPNGQQALLSTKQGMALYKFTDKSWKELLANKSSSPDCGFTVQSKSSLLSWLVPTAHAAISCTQYSAPEYSPDGRQARVGASYYEQGESLLINPETGDIIKEFGSTKYPIIDQEWKSYALTNTSTTDLGDGLSYFASFTATSSTYLLEDLGLHDSQSASWSSNGKLFGIVYTDNNDLEWAVFTPPSSQYQVVHTTENDDTYNTYARASLWLEDNSKILVSYNKSVIVVDVASKDAETWSSQALGPIALLK